MDDLCVDVESFFNVSSTLFFCVGYLSTLCFIVMLITIMNTTIRQKSPSNNLLLVFIYLRLDGIYLI